MFIDLDPPLEPFYLDDVADCSAELDELKAAALRAIDKARDALDKLREIDEAEHEADKLADDFALEVRNAVEDL